MAPDRPSSPNERQSGEVDHEVVTELGKNHVELSSSTVEPPAVETSSEKKVFTQVSDFEPGETESIVANTEEIALKALHVDDDPTLNPWTFRVFFLGRSRCATPSWENSDSNRCCRFRTICLWISTGNYFPIQTTICVGLDHFSHRHFLWRGSWHGYAYSKKRNIEVAQSSPIQLERTPRYRHHVEFSLRCSTGYRSSCCAEAVLQRHS